MSRTAWSRSPDPEGTASSQPPGDDHVLSGGPSFWVALVLSSPFLVYGVMWLFDHAGLTEPPAWGRWHLAALIAHDFVFAPLAALGGWIASRILSLPMRAPVGLAALASAAITLYTIPLLIAPTKGIDAGTVLPLDYSANLTYVLVVIWLVALVAAAVRWRRWDS